MSGSIKSTLMVRQYQSLSGGLLYSLFHCELEMFLPSTGTPNYRLDSIAGYSRIAQLVA